jgi:hypothetical protein
VAVAKFYLVYLILYMVLEGKHERLVVPSWMPVTSIDKLNLLLDKKWSYPPILQLITGPSCIDVVSKKPYFIANLQ